MCLKVKPVRRNYMTVRRPEENDGKCRDKLIPEMGDFGSGSGRGVNEAFLDNHAAHAMAHEYYRTLEGTGKLAIGPQLLNKRFGQSLDSLWRVACEE